MRRFATVLFLIFLLAAAAYAQPNNPSVRYVGSAPSGACSQAPPVQVLNSSGAIYTCNNGTWAVQGGGSGTVAWEKKGTVIFGGSTDATAIGEPTVFPVPSPLVITNVPSGTPTLGMFYGMGATSPSMYYAESLDGSTWVGGSASISGHAHSCEATISGTIYILAANATSGSNGIDIYSFISGTPALVKANIVTNGGVGWRQNSLGNCGFWHDLDGSYYLLYDGQSAGGNWTVGLATCTAPGGGMTCTDYGSNPVISPLTAGGTIGNPKSVRQLAANSYETWLHGTALGTTGVLPTDGYFATAPSPHGPWTIQANSVLPRTEPIEGVNVATAQIADLDAVDFNSGCFTYYTQYTNGNTGFNGGFGLAVANLPCENLSTVTQTVARPPQIVNTVTTLTINAGPQGGGKVGSVIYGSDATNGYAEVNENNGGWSQICTAANGVCAGGGGVNLIPAGFLADAFTGTNLSLLSAHTANMGSTWARSFTTDWSGTLVLNGTGYVYEPTSTLVAGYISNWTPATADYSVQTTCLGNSGAGTNLCGPIGRAVAGSRANCYGAVLVPGTGVMLYKWVTGTATQIGTTYAGVTSGSHVITLVMKGTAISVNVDGAAVAGPSGTDSAFAAAAAAGVVIGGSYQAASSFTAN